MIGISSTLFDTQGDIVIRNERTLMPEITRRVRRAATLDGAVVIEDMGMSHGDRTFDINIMGIDEAEKDGIAYIASNYSEINIATSEGAFIGAVESFRMKYGSGVLRLLIKSKLT